MKNSLKKKKEKTPTYNMTLEQIEGVKRKAVDEAVEAAFVLMFGLPVMQLHDKHGFTPEDIDCFIDGVSKLYEEYNEGRITLGDVHEALKEEAGVTFETVTRRKK